MKKIRNVIIILLILICVNSMSSAHGGNITGWKDKYSKNIDEYDGKYYGYHKEDGKKHYHQVKWDEENKRWAIVMPAVYYDESFSKIENNYDENTNKVEVKLTESVDGDTAKFNMNGEQVTVRFLGINTKETVDPEIGEEAWGKEASDFTKEKLKNATKIELEFDNLAEQKDKYDRYLAWIWVDEELLQNLLVKNGLAENYMLQNNYRYAGMLQESEEIARNNKLGIWSEETSDISEDILYSKENNEYVYLGILIMLISAIFRISQNKNKRK
ncbi:MAG: thermonuclease family protein [Clostridia bacterium]|nr:thermonuclease family protein [Clostridia bacterium]